jgi:hypothetical protein
MGHSHQLCEISVHHPPGARVGRTPAPDPTLGPGYLVFTAG